jgi:two-component sensor histidine kinase
MPASIQQLHPKGEAERLAALRRYDILDTPPEKTFDRVTSMAARLFSVPISVISFVDESRIWFKSHYGVNVQEIGREPGLCASAILQRGPWVLKDASSDPRSRANPLVTGDFGLRFYVGAPLTTQDGFNLGMLCVLDREPRPVSQEQLSHLEDLAAIVMEQLELRLSARRAIAGVTQLAGERETALELAGWLAKESDDRVQSSLEMVTGLLRHQSRTIRGSQCATELTIAANRVFTICRAHQFISAASGGTIANPTDYLRQICAECSGSMANGRAKEVRIEGLEMKVSSGQLIAIGLIVNELVTNAARYGGEQIDLLLERDSGDYRLTVSDDGPGLPDSFDPAVSKGLGLKIVLAQLPALTGRLDAANNSNGPGARFTVSFGAIATA